MNIMNFKITISAAICAIMLTACTEGATPNTDPKQAANNAETAAVTAPASATTSSPLERPAEDAGFIGYVIQAGDRMLVTSPYSRDFSANGGASHFYEAIWFSAMPPAIEPGMKVEVWADGPINESYPGQGKAKRAAVIEADRPEGAALSEAEAIRRAMFLYAMDHDGYPVVTGAEYDPSSTLWTVSITSNGSEDTVPIEVSDREQGPDMGALYGLALDAFMTIDDGLNDGMQYIAVDMSNFYLADDDDRQQILEALRHYEVEVKEATYGQLRALEPDDSKSIGLKGVLLRVDKVMLTDRRMVLEGSKFKSGKAAIGTKIVVELKDGRWQVTQADGTWIS